ncbi:MAG TPA: Hsp70 family protein, partial [Candidatus Methylomirabilis sp.]|nr:Hsp70 family protein [Candidatus Methylomirabilis sp.]
LPTEDELAGGGLALPWDEHPGTVVGVLAREQGALVLGRLVASAKSWLCHGGVDRTAKILPWGVETGEAACSPVEASTRYLAHLRNAWNHTMAQGASGAEDRRFELQEIVLTVPASFDEEARELTVQAARDSGIVNLTLLEEPLASCYAWIAAHGQSLRQQLKDGTLILVCDVGGGTTDFSLIRVHLTSDDLQFERIAIGEHLLLGGDNVDLALAHLVEEKLGHPKLSLRQRSALRRQACAAKERLLSEPEIERLPMRVLGSGSSMVGGALGTDVTREEVKRTLLEGFLPLTGRDDLPLRTTRTGLRELGLPYAEDPAITRHLAAFLSKTAETDAGQKVSVSRPDAILFNGGFFTPTIARQRVIEAMAGWFPGEVGGWRPNVLRNDEPASAVAVGGAYYGHVRLASGLRIRAGTGRAYYIGVQVPGEEPGLKVHAVCVMPRGSQEGTTLALTQQEFAVLTNQPVSFTLYSSTVRQDIHGQVVTLEEKEVHRHAPLVTVLRYGRPSRHIELAVHLNATFTEVGTLELWCESRKSEHRWRLQFQLRGTDRSMEASGGTDAPKTVIPDASLAAAHRLIRAVYAGTQSDEAEAVTADTLGTLLEATLGYGKDTWTIAVIRTLFDVLMEVADGRKQRARSEARWLNLAGFCLRPGFGTVLDDWRIGQLRKVYLGGLAFPKDIQCQVEWLVLWRRVAGGLNAGRQWELYQRQAALLGVGGKKAAGRASSQTAREGWRLLASLEHLPGPVRIRLGEELVHRIEREPTNQSFIWALGRLGARIPFYGPINCAVPAAVAEQWIGALLHLKDLTPEVAAAVLQLGARTNDPGRDIGEELRQLAVTRLTAAGTPEALVAGLSQYVPPSRSDALRIFGDSLPEGLRLVS